MSSPLSDKESKIKEKNLSIANIQGVEIEERGSRWHWWIGPDFKKLEFYPTKNWWKYTDGDIRKSGQGDFSAFLAEYGTLILSQQEAEEVKEEEAEAMGLLNSIVLTVCFMLDGIAQFFIGLAVRLDPDGSYRRYLHDSADKLLRSSLETNDTNRNERRR